MKILNAEQLKELDQFTIENEPIESINLMERAALAFTRWFTEKFSKDIPITIFCGPGDNGADGLAIARLLKQKMYTVSIYHVKSKKTSPNYQINEERLAHLLSITTIQSYKELPVIDEHSIVIDALFGSGINKPIEGLHADTINAINKSLATVVAVDMPSGLYIDKQNEKTLIVEADYTISFQIPKLAFMFPQHFPIVGEWYALNIGLSREYVEGAQTNYFYCDESIIKNIIKKRSKFSHKGDYGKCLLIAGSYGMLGAAVLSTKACLRTGSGLVYAYVPEAGFFVMQNDLPEAMVLTDEHPEIITAIPSLEKYNAIAVGPGIGEQPETVRAFEQLLTNCKIPLVIDASALSILASNKKLLTLLPINSILTPHFKEFEKLVGKSENDYIRLEKAKFFSATHKIYLVLKGAHTAVVCPNGNVYFNSTGNPGMATAGSGDVLTGIITSLLGQRYTSEEAALLGVFLHGYAGDAAARRLSQHSLMASDIIKGITQFYKDFSR